MMKLACLLIAFAVVGTYADEPEKLVNAQSTNIQQYPHCISIRVNNNHICGGSLISPYYVITAGHCLPGVSQNPSAATVVTGTTYLNSGGQSYKIARVISHPDYNPNYSPLNDIGLIKLASPVSFNSAQQKISLPSRPLYENEPVEIAAWGSQGLRQPIHNDLRKLNMKVMNLNTCQAWHKQIMAVGQNEFCTLIATGTGACHGDSGSGVIRGNEIVGLVSRGYPCARGYPDVFTKVDSYVSWIQQNMV